MLHFISCQLKGQPMFIVYTGTDTKVGTPVICVNNLLSLPSFINIYSNRHRYQFVRNNLQLKQSVCNWLKWHLTAQYQTTQIQTYQHQREPAHMSHEYVNWQLRFTYLQLIESLPNFWLYMLECIFSKIHQLLLRVSAKLYLKHLTAMFCQNWSSQLASHNYDSVMHEKLINTEVSIGEGVRKGRT